MKNSGKSKKIRIKLSERTKKILTGVLVVAVIILIVMTAAQKLGNMTISTFTADVKTYFMSLGSGDGYPYEISASKVKSITVNKSNLNLLLDDKTISLTSSAKEIMPKSHTYSNPVMKTKGSKMIVFDLDSGKFRVQRGSDIVAEKTLDKNITAAAIGAKSNYAVASYGKDVQSVLTVYNRNGKEKFTWNFSDERVTDIDLSPNGKYVAVAAVNAKNGEMSSKLYVFNLSKTDNYISCFDYNGTTLLRVNYIKGNNIVAVGDNLKSYIKNNTDRQDDLNFNSDKLHNYCVTQDGSSILALSKYGSSSLSSLTFYNNRNKERFNVDFDKEIRGVDTDGKYIAVLFDSEVKTFNKRGKQVGTIYFTGEPKRVTVDGSKTYILTGVNIKSYKTKGTTDERQASE